MIGFGLAVGLADRWAVPMLLVALLMLVLGGGADMASSAFATTMFKTAATDEVRGLLQGVFIVVVAGGRASPTPSTASPPRPSARPRRPPVAGSWW